MKISTKGRYAVRALAELAQSGTDQPVMLSQVAGRQEIPERYLIQIFSALRQGGLVRSFRGAKGGFQLARHPREINLADILEATEGPIELVSCLQEQYDQCGRMEVCFTRAVWEKINKQVKSVFAGMTLEDIVQLDQEQRNNQEDTYQI